MPLTLIDLPDAQIALDRHWLPADQAQALFTALRTQVPWEVHRIKLFGRTVDSPRLSCWIGDADACYTYSRTRFVPHPWPAALLPIRHRLHGECGVEFNSVLANLYRDGRDAMGWHSDNEPELGPQPVIASLSLGATRRFVLKARRRDSLDESHDEQARTLALELAHGSLLLMRGQTQARYRHALPRTAKATGARINLTFRCIRQIA